MPPHKKYTLVLTRTYDTGRILLGLKKRGFGVGKWNGFGGKVQPGESIEDAAVRELKEESGLTAIKMKPVGLLHFEFENNPVLMEVHVFDLSKYECQPTESEEMRPEWFNESEIPYDKMWADDRFWWPYYLRGEPFYGSFKYKDEETIIKHEITATNGNLLL